MTKSRFFEQLLFYILWIFYSGVYYLLVASSLKFNYDIHSLNVASQMITLLGLGVLLIKQHYSIKNLCLIGGILMLSLLVMNREVMILLLFALCAYRIPFTEFLKMDILIKLMWLSVILWLYFTGVLPNVDGSFYGVYKQSLGFQHPNTFAMNSYVILMEYLCLRYKKLNISDIAVLLGGFLVIYLVTHSRTTSYSFLGIFLVVLIAKAFPQLFRTKLVKAGFIAFVPVLIVLTIVLTVMYGDRSNFILKFNKILSGRIFLQFQYWNQYRVTLFGQDFGEAFSGRYFLDSGYLRALLEFGAVFLALLCVMYIITFYRCLNNYRTELALLALFCTLLGFTESSFLKVTVNISFLLFFNQSVSDKKLILIRRQTKNMGKHAQKKILALFGYQ